MSEFILSAFADEFAPGFQEQMEICRKFGISHIEIRGVGDKNFCDCTLSEAKELKRQMDDGGFRLSAIGSPIGKIDIRDPFEPHLDQFKRVLDLCDLMEAGRIRMFSFFMPKGEDPARYRDEVLERWNRFIEAARGRGILLLHENEKEIYGDTPERCLDLLQTLDCDYLRGVFDPANFVQCDVQPYPRAFELLAPYIDYYHIKDARFSDHGVVPSGEGDGGLPEILRELHRADYHGFLTLEPHLADFGSFKALERGRGMQGGRPLSGAEVLELALSALNRILDQIKGE